MSTISLDYRLEPLKADPHTLKLTLVLDNLDDGSEVTLPFELLDPCQTGYAAALTIARRLCLLQSALAVVEVRASYVEPDTLALAETIDALRTRVVA